MGISKKQWANPREYIVENAPETPFLFFSPDILRQVVNDFRSGFPGLVTYALKSNPSEEIVVVLDEIGLEGYDCASPFEINMIRSLSPKAAIHYNNPVRSPFEINYALDHGVKSYSVDSFSELQKLIDILPSGETEVAVRFKLPVAGAAYNFGAKFGATSEVAVELLKKTAQAGFVPSMTFHPGTQCIDPAAWESYIYEAVKIVRKAGVELARLNVGGGFPSHRLSGVIPELAPIFECIDKATQTAFGASRPALLCEPGRALVAESMTLASPIKALRDDDHVFLADGIYGSLAELALVGAIDRMEVMAPNGDLRKGESIPRIIFGPTCDSTDRLPGEFLLPDDLCEGDYLIVHGMGAYSTATNTRFNGYGVLSVQTVSTL